MSKGEYSHDGDVHLATISAKMDGLVIGHKLSDERRVEPMKNEEDNMNGLYSRNKEIHLTNISAQLAQEHIQK